MNITDVAIVGGQSAGVEPSDVDAFESELWIKFPPGYREYITKLGVGELSGFVRLYSPRRIRAELSEWRRRIERYWHWEESEVVFPKERAIESIIIADTVNGDELAFHPCRPQSLFVMPIDERRVAELGSDLFGAIDWMCSSGVLTEPISEREFEPIESEVYSSEDQAGGSDDPEGESLDDIFKLGKAWGKRHKVGTLARQQLKEHVRTGQKSRVLYEGLLWEGGMIHGDGYVIAYSINDEATGLQVGTYQFSKSECSQGGGYAPNRENQKKLAEERSV